MDDRLKILLEHVIALICRRIPKGYHDIVDSGRELGDIERILKTVYSSPAIPSGAFGCTVNDKDRICEEILLRLDCFLIDLLACQIVYIMNLMKSSGYWQLN